MKLSTVCQKRIHGQVSKLVKQQQRFFSLPPNLLLVSDLDHTLIGKGSDDSKEECIDNVHQFNSLWQNEYAPQNGILIYATGRSFDKVERAMNEWPLIKPDILICKDGTELYWFNHSLFKKCDFYSQIATKQDNNSNNNSNWIGNEFCWKDNFWEDNLKDGWDQEFAESLHWEYRSCYKDSFHETNTDQLHIEPFRVSVTVTNEEQAHGALEFLFKKIDNYNCNSNNNDSDNDKDKDSPKVFKHHTFHCLDPSNEWFWVTMTPEFGGKGNALHWVLTHLEMYQNNDDDLSLMNRVIVCGDSGNDISMMNLNKTHSNAVIVANCSTELRRFYYENKHDRKENVLLTTNNRTLGVMEGLKHFSSKLTHFSNNL